MLALYRCLSSLPLHCYLPHVFFETDGTIVLLSFTILLLLTQKALSKISLNTLIWHAFSLSPQSPEDIRNLDSHTHTQSCAMTTEHCFEVSTYTHPYKYHVTVSQVLQLFPATNEKHIKKLLCNSHEYFNIRLCSLGCDAVLFASQESKLQRNLLSNLQGNLNIGQQITL